MRRIPIKSLASLLLSLACLSVPASAQSYGLDEQVLHVGAASFQYMSGAPDHFVLGDGYLYFSINSIWEAPLRLPPGAEIRQICLYARVNGSGSVHASLKAVKFAVGTILPGVVTIPGSFIFTNFNSGYGVVCSAPFSYTYRDQGDVDGDGNLEDVVYTIEIADQVQGSLTAALGGVRVFWRRQVSPPPATPTFNDVPATDGAYAFIEALAAAGITAGCNSTPPRYCPDSPVTRRQVAVYLARALGLHWPN